MTLYLAAARMVGLRDRRHENSQGLSDGAESVPRREFLLESRRSSSVFGLNRQTPVGTQWAP